MELTFLGKRKAGCKCGGGNLKWENKSHFSLFSPFGIKQFRRGNTYSFDSVDEYDYWRESSYYIKGTKYYYFKTP